MSLSSEDLLRLNVLLAHDLQAVRIDEQTLTVFALTAGDEARIPLNPNARPEQYLRRVREALSSHALGSPGGYPVFLQRWTRMGQARDAQLEKLLLLGESEAVVAVAGAPGLTDEIARRAWWAMPTADVARRMLEREAVVHGRMGKILADYLVEHLPFETEPLTVIDTVRLVLQPGLIDDATRSRLWARGTSRNAYRLGFLAAVPDALPGPPPARADFIAQRARLAPLADMNPLAAQLLTLLDAPGQAWLALAAELLRHPLDKYTVALLLDEIGKYFSVANGADAGAVLAAAPGLEREIAAVRALARCGEALATPIISKTSATGTLLKRKLEPVVEPLLAQIGVLQGKR
jgi:hypothetical protein